MKMPVLTHHARERCKEMKLTVQTVKDIVANADLTYAGKPSRDGTSTTTYLWSDQPDYAVICLDCDPAVVMTVVFRQIEPYTRAGKTFSPMT